MISKKVLENSSVYELGQRLVGSHVSDMNMREILGAIGSGARVLDAGGGTGAIAEIFDGHHYWCMDIDAARVRRASKKGVQTLVGDASRMPVATAAIDVVVLRAVSHHLTDQAFAMTVDESWRVLKPGGSLLFLDAVWSPRWLPGRFMWGIDQGSHPRTEEQMQAFLTTRFDLERTVTYARYHRYFLTLARPRAQTQAHAEQSSNPDRQR